MALGRHHRRLGRTRRHRARPRQPGRTEIVRRGFGQERRAGLLVHRLPQTLVVSRPSRPPSRSSSRSGRPAQFTAVAEAADSTPDSRGAHHLGGGRHGGGRLRPRHRHAHRPRHRHHHADGAAPRLRAGGLAVQVVAGRARARPAPASASGPASRTTLGREPARRRGQGHRARPPASSGATDQPEVAAVTRRRGPRRSARATRSSPPQRPGARRPPPTSS